MFDFSWSEILVIGGVALIVIGPKDLPRALRTAGALVRRARGLARDFHDSVDELMREADLDEAQRNFQRTLGNAFTDDDPPRSIHAPVMTAKPAAAEPVPAPEQQGTLPLAPGEPSHPPRPPEP